MIKKKHIIAIAYFSLIAILLYIIALSKNFEQIPIKVLCSSLLVTIYGINIPKEKWNNNYFILVFLFWLGDVFYSYPYKFFIFSLLFYMSAYIIFTLHIYKNKLTNKDRFRIFTFASPFIFTYTVIFMMLKNLTPFWILGALLVGTVLCINASITLLHYADKRSKGSYLFFIGFFIIQMVNSLTGIYYFNEQKQSYYLIINSLSLVAQYFICLGFISSETANDSDESN